MVKIRLRRIGTKARPFYRVVVTPSTAARNGRFVETLGTYDPVRKPTHVEINAERALHWLLNGAKPTETTALLLNRIGVLDRFFEQRPAAKKDYSFLDKRTAAMTVQSVIEPAAKKESTPTAQASAPVSEAAPPVAEAVAEPEAVAPEGVAPEEAPAAEPEAAAPEEAPVPEAGPAEETQVPEVEAAADEPAPETAEEKPE